MLTEKDFHDFDFDNPGQARELIRRKIRERVIELERSGGTATLLQELAETIWFAWQCGYTEGGIEAGRIWDQEDDQS
ncbi:MAG TPA: hypothetical protein VHV32_19505 [Candidatus Angelobacter sp.]|jgi:hypothetical protein|nr:hypothetical protein [Candidatus Angelobacter sp.]